MVEVTFSTALNSCAFSSSLAVMRRSTRSELAPGQMVMSSATEILISGSSRRLMEA